MLANYKRGRGDNMGPGGWLNDQANITMQVGFYPPNDFGLYDMAGNVAEWVLDVYRPLTPEDMTDHRAFRGNRFETFDDNYEDIGTLEVLQDPQWTRTVILCAYRRTASTCRDRDDNLDEETIRNLIT